MDEPLEDSLAALPHHVLRSGQPTALAFLGRGCLTLREAAAYVWTLPYGRNSDPSRPLCVLEEGRGTCSSKHALLARLLAEEGVRGIDLYLGIYEMREANTPGVGRVLARYGLDAIPEAHCYLRRGSRRIDVTRLPGAGQPGIETFLQELPITPDQVGEFKRNFHRRVLAELAGTGSYRLFTAEALWAIREECIEAISGEA